MEKKLTYISLFSGGGVGCYGLKQQGFNCVVTNELIPRRLNIQKVNEKCLYPTGYIEGDISEPAVYEKVINEIDFYKKKQKVKDIDVIIATPPCQGMSVANHKKSNGEIYRNSLVVEAIRMVEVIKPKFFIFENVRAFMNTNCYDQDVKMKISESLENRLGEEYVYETQIMNLKDYGANSSRTRTIVIGVRKDFSDFISPILLFPDREEPKTIEELIGHLPRLTELGEIHKDDIYHNFKKYQPHMRAWIKDVKEGASAFDNEEVEKKPHRIINGEIKVNANKNGDKYTRQRWKSVAPCIHTRNDTMASQSTLHPEDDRVFSIRELMTFMNIPGSFKWAEESEAELNKLTFEEKEAFFKEHEMNIRQSIGEGIPTIIVSKIAKNIKEALLEKNLNDREIKKVIAEKQLDIVSNLRDFVIESKEEYTLNTLSRMIELANQTREQTAAHYTNLTLLNSVYKELPHIEKDHIRILEPSVGAGNFIPFILKKYEYAKKITLDVCDINADILELVKMIYHKEKLPENVEINVIHSDFVLTDVKERYDLVIGNPPFLKLNQNSDLSTYRDITGNDVANNSAAYFLEKSIMISDYVALILPKYFLHNTDFSLTREKINEHRIETIIDFGEHGFKGVLIETICVMVSTTRGKGNTKTISIPQQLEFNLPQHKVTDPKFPNWLLYRDEFFDHIVKKLELGIFTAFRDRQLTNGMLNENSGIRVIKSRNISDDGTELLSLPNYDSYIEKEKLNNLAVSKYLERDDVYLVPNMTYYPRMMKKKRGTIVNGSVAILELEKEIELTEKDLVYFSTPEFRKFYSIARNKSTRSLNIDKRSVYYFGVQKKG